MELPKACATCKHYTDLKKVGKDKFKGKCLKQNNKIVTHIQVCPDWESMFTEPIEFISK